MSVSFELLCSPLNHRTIEPLNPCTHSYHAHVEHTKTLQGLDTLLATHFWLQLSPVFTKVQVESSC